MTDVKPVTNAPRVERKWGQGIKNYFTAKEGRTLLKIDMCLLVWAFVAGLCKDMDQSATTQAYVSGMKEALSLNGNELVEFTTYFSIGYALGIVPAQLLQTRIRPSIFLPVCEIIWGFLTLATYACKSAKSIYALRFLLGLFESTSWPGLVALIFNWYTERELATRLAIFGVSSSAGSMFLGILQAALYKNLNGVHGLEGWQWLFIVCGIITVVWGFIGLVVIPDSPANTRALWLTKPERGIARQRMSRQGTTVADKISGKALRGKLVSMFKSPLTYFFIASYLQFAWSQRANSYILLYLKSIRKPDGTPLYSTYTVNLLPLGGYSIAIVCSITLNAISDWKRWRWQISVFPAIVQIIACAVLASWPKSDSVKMGFYYLTFSTSAWGYALTAWMAEILRKEPEARAVLIGLTVTLVYIGHATIPLRAWRVADSPRYPIGFPLAASFAAGSIATISALYFWVKKNPELEMYGFVGEVEFLANVAESAESIDEKRNEKETVISSKET